MAGRRTPQGDVPSSAGGSRRSRAPAESSRGQRARALDFHDQELCAHPALRQVGVVDLVVHVGERPAQDHGEEIFEEVPRDLLRRRPVSPLLGQPLLPPRGELRPRGVDVLQQRQ